MWIDLFIHRTTAEHESRWISVINPATEYAVRSPFQHPFYKTCEVSCIREPILPYQRCEWHGSCCRLDYQRLPFLNPGQHTRPPICFHLHEGELEKLPLGFLDYLRSCDPLMSSTLLALFLTGIELSLATLFEQQLNHILTYSLTSRLSATDRSCIEERASFFSTYANNSLEFLGQIARSFDLQNEFAGAFLPRPGKESRPELNTTEPYFPFLQVVSFSGADISPTPWPSSVVVWPNTETILRNSSDGCSLVPWATGMPIQLGNTMISVEHFNPLPNAMSVLGTTNISPQKSPFPSGHTLTPRTGPPKEDSDIGQVEPDWSPGSNRPDLVPNNGSSPKCRSEANSADSLLDAECDPVPESLSQHQSVDTTKDENGNDDSDSDEESTYPVEALLSHRPPVADRSKVRSYKVRWAGEWPASQKQTWEPTSNIAVDIVDSYWADLERKKRHRRQRKKNWRGVRLS